MAEPMCKQQADEPRPCRRCMAAMAAVSLSVDVIVYIMHGSQVIRSAACLCIDSPPDGCAHGSTALLRSPSDITEPPTGAADKQVIPR